MQGMDFCPVWPTRGPQELRGHSGTFRDSALAAASAWPVGRLPNVAQQHQGWVTFRPPPLMWLSFFLTFPANYCC